MHRCAYVALVVAIGSLASCSSKPADPVGQAMDSVAQASTFSRLAHDGEGYGNRYRDMPSLVPEVSDLVAGGSPAAARMLSAFSGQPAFEDEATLVVFAYAIGEMGYLPAVPGLADFVEANLDGDLWLAPQAATHTILLLLGDPKLKPQTFSYSAADMTYAVAAARAAGASGVLTQSVRGGGLHILGGSSGASRASCRRRYLFVDSSGAPVTYVDGAGTTQVASVEGVEFANIQLGPKANAAARDLVSRRDGEWVTALDGGQPNRRFDCAGYAFRELNGGGGWWLTPEVILPVLLESGLLAEKHANPMPGDKVFYFNKSGVAAHVAEVLSAPPGMLVTVRNADGASGVFDATVDAATPDYPTHKYYAWASPPHVLEDPSTAGDPRYCNGTPPQPPNSAAAPADAGNSGQTGAPGTFAATITVEGASVPFAVGAVAGGWAVAGAQTQDPSVFATTASTLMPNPLADSMFGLIANPSIIQGAGLYSFDNQATSAGGAIAGDAVAFLTSPAYSNADGSPVTFVCDTGGSLSITTWGRALGDELAGSLSCTLSGSQSDGDGGVTVLTGSMSGTFDVTLTYQTMP